MANEAATDGTGRAKPWRIAGWSIAALLLLLPAVAMQFTTEVNWTGEDFIFAGVMFGGTGLLYELTVRMSRNYAYRAGVGFALAATFLTIWANGAVGMIGDEGNPYNLLFLGVILIALAGALISWFHARGMAVAMTAAAVAQVCVALGGVSTDLLGGILSGGFCVFWLISARLFTIAARAQRAGAAV